MKYVLFYESGERVAELAPLHFPAHRARWSDYAERGLLLAIGPFTDGAAAMLIADRSVAERLGLPIRARFVVRAHQEEVQV